MPVSIAGLGFAPGPHRYTQDEIFKMSAYERRAIEAIFKNSGIETRTLCVEPHYKPETDPNWFSKHYERWAIELGVQAAKRACEKAGLKSHEIDYLVVSTCTGYLCPGLAQRLASELKLNSAAKTANLAGMGCNAAVPALERAAEFTQVHPKSNALVVSVEISSAAYWLDDNDSETAVGNAIFADGASAAVINNSGRYPQILHFSSRSNRECVQYMGFANQDGRLRVKLAREIPEAVLPLFSQCIDDLCSAEKIPFDQIKSWAVHPGGKKILEKLEEKFKFGDRLDSSRRVLREFGNLSSATVLYVLDEELKRRAGSKDYAFLAAMGPGLSVESALLALG